MMREEFEQLFGTWTVTDQEYEEVIEPCYMYLPEEAIGCDQETFAAWLREHDIVTTEDLRRTWLPIALDIKMSHEQQQRQQETIRELREHSKEKDERVIQYENRVLSMENRINKLQRDLQEMTNAVDELSMYVSDGQIVHMVEDIGRANFIKWYMRRSAE